jgi:bifunctional UDP-N-acetylglucosamine pyrophosphorylase/glucosamine-1-phosphate N-acetyltransferase
MKSKVPKVLQRVAGRPILGWVLEAVAATNPDRVCVVIGHGADEVTAFLPDRVETAEQAERLGTGHAVQVALDALGPLPPDSAVMVVPGDTPLVTGEVLRRLVDGHDAGAAVTLLTARVEDPAGYGRILRDGELVTGIVEHDDADGDVLAIGEINAGMYVFDGAVLQKALSQIDRNNAKGEYYLPDAVAFAADNGEQVRAVVCDPVTVGGVNTQTHLAEVNVIARRRLAARALEAGVLMIDPSRVYLDADVTVEPGAVIYPGCHLEGATFVETGAVVGPDVFAVDTRIGSGARVWYAVLRQAEVGPDVEVGPYTSLRPGTVLAPGSKAGTFVEMKNSTVGEGTKVPHLSYLGDATVGRGVNVGAGTITCNYDGYTKSRTVIEDGAFIGSDTMLVAPVTVGAGAVTGAGSVIASDVEPGSLGLERTEQRNIPGYADRRAARYRAERAEADAEG